MLSPTSATEAKQVLTVTIEDPKGIGHIESVKILVNDTADGRAACFIQYVPREKTFFLVNDSGVGSKGLKTGDYSALSNSQCRLDGAGSSSDSYSGKLKLVLDLQLQPGFTGQKQIFIAASDTDGKDSGFQKRGSWKVSDARQPVDLAPSAGSVVPSSGEGNNGTFTFTYSSANGPAVLADVRVLVNRKADGSSACYIWYNRNTGQIRLIKDSGTESTAVAMNSGKELENSQCIVHTANSSVAENRSELELKLSLTFKPSFAGRKNMYLYAQAYNGTDSGMRRMGTWAVPYADE